jgi:CRISPR type IV-associated protein Csf2
MNEQQTYAGKAFSIEGVCTLNSPLHVASPVGARLDDRGRVIAGDNGKPLTRTMIEPMVGRDGQPVDVPFFPANDLRGRLRRQARDVVVDIVGKVSLNAHHGMSCGAVTGRPAKGNSVDINELRRNLDHVFLGLYGGGPRMVPSAYSVEDMLPIVGALVGDDDHPAQIPARYADRVPTSRYSSREEPRAVSNPNELLAYRHIFRVDDLIRASDTNLLAQVINLQEASEEWQGRLSTNRAAVGKAKDAKEKARADAKASGRKASVVALEPGESKLSIATMSAVEVIISGTPMFFRATVRPHNDAQFGLFLLSLAGLANAQNLGGWGRTGFGRFTPELTVYGRDGHVLGTALRQDPESKLWVPGEAFEAVAALAEETIGQITPESLDTVFFEEATDAAEDEAA